MSKLSIRKCGEEEFLALYNERDFNPFDSAKQSAEDFSAEFWGLIENLELVLSDGFSSYDSGADEGDYTLYDGHNSTRFIDLAFENDRYLDRDLCVRLQKLLGAQKEPWMICLWFTNFLFVTADAVIVYEEDAHALEEWWRACEADEIQA